MSRTHQTKRLVWSMRGFAAGAEIDPDFRKGLKKELMSELGVNHGWLSLSGWRLATVSALAVVGIVSLVLVVWPGLSSIATQQLIGAGNGEKPGIKVVTKLDIANYPVNLVAEITALVAQGEVAQLQKHVSKDFQLEILATDCCQNLTPKAALSKLAEVIKTNKLLFNFQQDSEAVSGLRGQLLTDTRFKAAEFTDTLLGLSLDDTVFVSIKLDQGVISQILLGDTPRVQTSLTDNSLRINGQLNLDIMSLPLTALPQITWLDGSGVKCELKSAELTVDVAKVGKYAYVLNCVSTLGVKHAENVELIVVESPRTQEMISLNGVTQDELYLATGSTLRWSLTTAGANCRASLQLPDQPVQELTETSGELVINSDTKLLAMCDGVTVATTVLPVEVTKLDLNQDGRVTYQDVLVAFDEYACSEDCGELDADFNISGKVELAELWSVYLNLRSLSSQ